MKNILQKTKNQKGFSLLELVAAVSIISIGFIGLSSLANQSTQIEQANKNKIIASMLAQEGLEIVRNIRDENWLANEDWKRGISDTGNPFIYQYNSSFEERVSVSGIDDPQAILLLDPINNFYNINNGEQSIFSRIIETSDNGNSLDVACTVQWKERGKTEQYQASSRLYDWR